MTAAPSPHALLQRANHLLAAGTIPDAIRAHEELLAHRPDLPDSWYNLAYLQRCDRRFDEALASYAEALKRGVARPEEVHVNRAAILSEYLERGAEAEAELQAALRIAPRYLVAWLNLGNLYEDRGEPERARSAYEHALAVAPNNGRALARQTMIDIFRDDAGDAPARLRKALQSPGLSAEDAAELGFALGNALDAAGAYDEAFAAIAEANRVSRSSTPASRRYDPSAQEALVDALIAMPVLEPVQSNPPDRPRPLFICGMFRSGSTLAEQILARHSRVTAGGELEIVPIMVQTRLQPYPETLRSLSEPLLTELRDAYLEELRSIHPGADIVTDKRVDNFLHIGLIKSLFPDARIVHATRNAIDTILSVYFLHFDSNIAYGTDLGDITHWYKQYRRLMDHWRTIYGDDIHDLPYDDLVADPEPALRALLDFCGLDWQEACLNGGSGGGIVRTGSSWQVRQPLHRRSSGRWKNYLPHLRVVQEMLAAP